MDSYVSKILDSLLDEESPSRLMLTLISGSLLKFAISMWFYKKKYESLKTVGRVSGIFCYPVKSCARLSVDKAYCSRYGLRYKGVGDRNWMVIRPNNAFLSQRQEPKMALIQPNVEDEKYLQIDAPGMIPLFLPKTMESVSTSEIRNCSVWGTAIRGQDCGDEAASWMNKFLEKDQYRMVVSTDQLEKRDVKLHGGTPADDCQCIYQDSAPFNILSQASIDNVNSKVEKSVSEKNFRPNILVEGCVEFAEDTWGEIKIGNDVLFHYLEPCGRCLLPTVDPEKGVKDPKREPYETLKKYRTPAGQNNPNFGVMISVDKEGWIQVGDPIYALPRC